VLGYRIELTPDDNGTVLVTCPALPEVTTFAETGAEAPLRARDAIEEALTHRMADRDAIPAPSSAPEGTVAPLPTLTLAKVELYRALRDDEVSAAELADRMGVRTVVIERMLDLNHRTALAQVEAAFRALGRRLGIEVSSAA
jgi:antitoxin HicB